jgi:hypothetical protein
MMNYQIWTKAIFAIKKETEQVVKKAKTIDGMVESPAES